MKVTRLIARRLALVVVLLVAVATGSGFAGCAAHLSPKAIVDTADRAAYNALRLFQTAEETAWHANAGWPTPAQHQAINAKVSQTYQLIIDVANIGIALPPGSQLSVADLAVVTKLTAAVADIVTLTKGTPVATQATTTQTKVGALVAGVTGAKAS